MTLVLNFITALSWIWGVLMAAGFVLAFFESSAKSAGTAAYAVLFGIPAWAWLIARYML